MDDKVVFLSVIIPVYNAQSYLYECVRSILSQSFKNFEIIIVNDGSTDDSEAIALRLVETDSRVHYHSQPNQGSLAARITGLRFAGGEYFTFCDADDEYATDKAFQLLHDTAASHPCDLIQFGSYIKYRFLRRKKVQSHNEIVDKTTFLSRDYPRLLCSFWDDSRLTVNIWNKMYRKALASQLPENLAEERVFWGDDTIMNLFLTEHCDSACYLIEPLYCHHKRRGFTNRWNETIMYDLNSIKRYQLEFTQRQAQEKQELLQKILYSEVAGWFFIHIQEGLKELSHEEMIRHIRQVLALPSFVKARAYYLSCNDENWEAVNLLREGDPEKYMAAAITAKKHESVSSKIKKLLAKII